MEIFLTPELTAIVEEQIASGAYESPEAVITAALLHLSDEIESAIEGGIEAENDRRWQKFQQTNQMIGHDTVKEWVDSLNHDRPLPCPK